MLKRNLWHVEHKIIIITATKIYICIHKLDYKILKIASKITKIPGTVNKLVSYLQKASFL